MTGSFDVSITANRPDCQSIFGLAREVAAALGQPLKDTGYWTTPRPRWRKRALR
ncbi:MAG: hypothetical protein ACLR8P_17420 [Clostridium fessum]